VDAVTAPAAERPKLLFVGAFPPPDSPITGGNVTACRALLSSSFRERLELVLVDSSREAAPAALLVRAFRAARRAPRFLAAFHREKPDAVLLFASFGMSFLEKALYAAYANALGVPSLLSVRSGHFMDQCRRSRGFRPVAAMLLRAPARLICQGERWQEFFGSTFAIPRSRCPVVDAWAASEDLLRIGRERGTRQGDRVRLLFLGTLEWFKGLAELLEALERLRLDPAVPPLELVIAGRGSAEQELRRIVERRGLDSVVRFAGLLSGREKVDALRRSDVFVLPSHTEGLPNAMIEAMAAGLAIVVTPVGSVPDVIVDGENGVLVPPRDPTALAKGLARVASSVELRTRIALEAHRVASARFSLENGAASLERIIREAIRERREHGRPA
jgi:glycosyltransferase involved in cell wall biosynthesis